MILSTYYSPFRQNISSKTSSFKFAEGLEIYKEATSQNSKLGRHSAMFAVILHCKRLKESPKSSNNGRLTQVRQLTQGIR